MTEPISTDYYLTIAGAQASRALVAAVEQLTVESSLHLPDMLTLVIYDPDLTWADSSTLALGAEVKVDIKESGASAVASTGPIFDGEIVELEVELAGEAYRTVVRAFDRLHRLARGSRTRTLLQVTDSDLVTKVAAEHGLGADAPATAEVLPYVIQSGESDLLLLQRRAAALGRLLYVEGAKLCFKEPDLPKTQAAITLNAHETLHHFRVRASTLGHVDSVNVRGWDVQRKQAVLGRAAGPLAVARVGEQVKGWFNKTAVVEGHDIVLASQAAAEKRARAQLLRSASRFIEAEGAALGDPRVLAGAAVQIGGMGTRFSGTYYITAATHRFAPGQPYSVEFSASGANPATILASLLPEAPAAPAQHLAPAIVADVSDPENLGRVKLKYPWLGDAIGSDWARVAAPGAGRGRGLQWTPEIDDEVLVGFAGGDMAAPVVLGGLWNGVDKPQLTSGQLAQGDGKVIKRSLKTTTGHEIVFDDAESAGGIVIKDKHNNSIEIKSSERLITITSQGDLTLKATKAIALEAGTGLTLKAGQALGVEAGTTLSAKSVSDLTLEASGGKALLKGNGGATVQTLSQLELKGTAGAKLESVAITEVKGLQVKLN